MAALMGVSAPVCVSPFTRSVRVSERLVHPQELRQEVAADPLDVAPRRRCHGTGEQRGQGHVDRRARQRHDQLLLRVIRPPLQSRHATDWQERDVAGANAVVPGGQCMTELVEHDDGKECKDEQDARPRVGQVLTLEVVAHADPGKRTTWLIFGNRCCSIWSSH